ncbi:hypothetical protein [uncultured Nostoc sp.]|uniref:hypothetical protein n=1 Tax=uncultured Nostoc sp. TaxID=340711 RepID=UPI002609032D|nr:hypothetical protein [uncultured Nostoc sp.]
MESQTSQQAVINPQTLQQLEDDIKNELSNILKNSNFGEVLKKYGISGQEIFKVQCILDLTQMKFSDAVGDKQVNELLLAISGQKMKPMGCVWYDHLPCCPDGGWVCP